MRQEIENCLYCGKRGELYPVKKWNKNLYDYYCKEHYKDALHHQQTECNRFIEYYSVKERRKWLNERSLDLWEKLSNQNKYGGNGNEEEK